MIRRGDGVHISGCGLLQSKRIQGYGMGSNRFRIEVPRYAQLYLQGRLKLDEMVSSRLTLDQVCRALNDLRAGEVIRNVIVFDS